MITIPMSKANILRVIALSLIVIFSVKDLSSQSLCPSCWVPVTKQRFVTNTYVSPWINGYVEYLPPAYAANPTKKFPLIIYFSGDGSQGPGSFESMCPFIVCGAMPLKIEENQFPDPLNFNGNGYSFIGLSPQFVGNVSGGADINAMIDYAVAHYRVDRSRIYLTGLSSGEVRIANFMSSSPQNAKKVAAVVVLGACSGPSSEAVSNYATNRIHYWGIQCAQDNVCNPANVVNWANAINSASPGNSLARSSLTPTYNPNFPHDVWYVVYGKDWRENAFNQSIYEWMIQFSSPTLVPATIDNFNAYSKNKQVVVEWTSLTESESDHFVIERSSNGRDFYEIGKVNAAGTSNGKINYKFVDPLPMRGNNFYRLVLVNRDYSKDYFDIKKVTTEGFGINVLLSPIPATKTLSVIFNINSNQNVTFNITDVNGKLLKTWSSNFTSGSINRTIDINSLSAGVYYLHIKGEEFTETKKFIKQ
jgi:type IX secretion system substrate protein